MWLELVLLSYFALKWFHKVVAVKPFESSPLIHFLSFTDDFVLWVQWYMILVYCVVGVFIVILLRPLQ